MSKYRLTKEMMVWIESKAAVAVGYYDEVKGVNLDYLLACWSDFEGQEHDFPDYYPHVADNLQVIVIERSDPRARSGGLLYWIADQLINCQHIKAWLEGESVDIYQVQRNNEIDPQAPAI